MQLVIDATSITERLTGIERYAFEVTKNIIPQAINAGYSIVLLIANRTPANKFKTSGLPGLVIKKSPFSSRLLTEQVWIPWVLGFISEAVCFFPAFPPSPVINLFNSRKRVIKTVFDAVMWRHPETVSWKNKFYMRPLETFWMDRYDCIHTISTFSMREITHLFPATKDKVIHSGIGYDYGILAGDHMGKASEEVKKRYDLPDEFILFVGTLEPRKNLVFLLEVVFQLKTQIPDIRLIVAGRFGWGADALFNCVKERQLTQNVIFLGSVPDNDLAQLYSAASIFVFPSLYEGFGLPVVEAMGAGTPVIASNTSSIPEASGDAAILLPPDNTDIWAEAIFTLLHDTELRSNLVKKGFQQVQKFNWHDVSKKILESL